ncbi:UNVERIFIED_CONTAM: hypothetical protein H355_014318 [Colinus virginianus]|nr:hypothetical protein H355_014318 [Colinus virginianus]
MPVLQEQLEMALTSLTSPSVRCALLDISVLETGDCPLGYNCPPGTGFPFSFPCTPGFFWDNSSAEGEDRCKPCPAGNYCDSPAMTEPKACPVLPTDGVTGDVCPAGTYCPPGSPLPIPCPPGTYSNVSGLRSLSQCLDCPPGEHMQTCSGQAHASPALQACTAAWLVWLNQKDFASLDITAVKGPAAPHLWAFCLEIFASRDITALLAQHTRKRGHALLAPGMTRGEPRMPLGAFLVPLGFSAVCLARTLPEDFVHKVRQTQNVKTNVFHVLLGFTVLKDCDAAALLASIVLREQESVFILVPLGLSTPPTDSARLRGARSALQECSVETGDSPLQVVPAGQGSSAQQGKSIEGLPAELVPLPTESLLVSLYRPYMWQESSCTACPSGHYCSSTALTAPSGLCSAGYYCLAGASSPSPPGVQETGGPCPVSHFCPEGASFPLACLAGTYNNLTRQAACFPCAAGYYCPENTTSYSMNPCPAGFYCPKGLPVPSGECTAGFYCKGGAVLPNPTDDVTGNICPAGTYCTAGSAEPKLCPAGTFSSLPGRRTLSACQPCPSGFYCEGPGLSAPTGECWEGDCAEGFWCRIGARVRNPQDGESGFPCPPGHYCPEGNVLH